MFIALILISIALIIQTIYLIYYKNQIRDIGAQLAFISKHDSFKFIQTQIKPKEINQLIDVCNTLLRTQRKQNQKFIKKNEEINETITSLSHDIRTPLTSLDGYLQLAERSENKEEKTHYISLAQTRIKQIITLVEELFLYTKLENPDYHLELESIDIINLLNKRLFFFIDDFSQNGTDPDLNLPEFPVYISGNKNALERVYENIIKNYFLHGEGILTIQYDENPQEFRLYFINLVKESELVNFNKIFTRFYKEDASRSKPTSGLGLSIVKSLVEKMNGYVHAELKENRFCISVIFVKNSKGENI
ncbi:sensor histidine kinase KdpD [Oceanobacillus sojae]|uniref:sensor histidine kinase n=1 Tax=Oceanobacillus sojae TaxID=582851 RepID=UPI0021A39549|nr:HAMP domain-containing sensor histidine kinase [Oceanobacillus sojae]MCT1903727.1 HAMP domain-containing histidine kinase [Oceanobacillus sojae]